MTVETGMVQRQCVIGGAGSGKTEALVDRVEGLLAGGAPVSGVRVFAATPGGAAALRARLVERLGERAEALAVETPRAFELHLLGSEAARAFTGREARVLLNFEANVLMEDMKTCGLRPGRLKEMLKFFYRSWTELADDDPSWIYTGEELQVHGLLKECLAFSRGMLEAELANFAVNYLRFDAAVLDALRVDHVLVDDYQLLCRASQVMAGMLARRTLWVAGDPCACAETHEPYPYVAGLEELAGCEGVAVERLETCRRPQATVDALNALRTSIAADLTQAERAAWEDRVAERARLENLTLEQMQQKVAEEGGAFDEAAVAGVAACAPRLVAAGGPAGTVESLVLASPDEELAAVADRVAGALAAGVAPADVYVATPNRMWTGGVAKALAARGIATVRPFDVRGLNGDVRDLARCGTARAFALLQLAADPANAQAWRSWCGFGDWLANSPGFTALRAMGLGAGANLYQTLSSLVEAADAAGAASALDMMPPEAELGADERASIERIVDAYRVGLAHLAALQGKRGAQLVQAACDAVAGASGAPVPAAVLQIFGAGCADDADAAALMARVEAQLGAAPFSQEGAVRLGSLEQLGGCAPRLLVVCGFVNGLTPRHSYFDAVSTSDQKRRQMRVAEARRLYAAVGACTGDVAFTSFTGIDGLQAERLDLKVDRIRMRDGRRVAQVSPSIMLGALGL